MWTIDKFNEQPFNIFNTQIQSDWWNSHQMLRRPSKCYFQGHVDLKTLPLAFDPNFKLLRPHASCLTHRRPKFCSGSSSLPFFTIKSFAKLRIDFNNFSISLVHHLEIKASISSFVLQNFLMFTIRTDLNHNCYFTLKEVVILIKFIWQIWCFWHDFQFPVHFTIFQPFFTQHPR